MYGFNVPARFTTDLGSNYDVTTGGVQRFKKKEGVDLGLHGGEGKNIFYVNEEYRERLLGFKHLTNRRVVSDGSEAIYLLYHDGERTRSIRFYKRPRLGLRPFDVYLNDNGTVPDHARRHLGHKIVKIA